MNEKIIRFFYKKHVASVLLGVGIVALCMIQMPNEEQAMTWPYFDKLVHFLMYLFLCGAYLFESSHKPSSGRMLNYLKGLIYCAIMAGTIELAQKYLTTYRSAEWLDFFAGMAGAITSCGLAILIRLAFRSRGR